MVPGRVHAAFGVTVRVVVLPGGREPADSCRGLPPVAFARQRASPARRGAALLLCARAVEVGGEVQEGAPEFCPLYTSRSATLERGATHITLGDQVIR